MPDIERNEPILPLDESAGVFARVGGRLADWCERWFPDAFVFALLSLLIVFGAGLFTGARPLELVRFFGDGFWSLIPFTLQMSIPFFPSFAVKVS